MKPFIKKIAFYIVAPIVLCHVAFVIIYLIVSVQVDKKLNNIATHYRVLIMGDSQMQKISPDLVDANACNIASPGEHFFFTYSKLQKLVSNEDHKIQCVLLGVSLHSFAPLFVNNFNLNSPEGKGSLKRYLFFFPLLNNDFIKAENIVLNKEFFLGVLNGPYWGGHDAFLSSNPQIPLIESRLKSIYDGSVEEEFKTKQQFYLAKIAALCSKENINLVIVSNPVHQYYKNHVDEVYFTLLDSAINNHSDLFHLNYLDDTVSNVHMNDANHLNKEGAEIYSRKIGDELKHRFNTFTVARE